MTSITVFNPVAETVDKTVSAAPRLDDLDGKRIGLFWNMKPGGDVALEETERILRGRYPRAQVRYYKGDIGSLVRHITYGFADTVSKECDALIGTTGD
ncbi:MAG: hypothetical protein KGJ98_09735 [Chloroflexota bacterium]|nr:hypothetical protein [Chloroflexota bacterium]MDE3102505.1 hypothetical protein [Chloroflexota bacterium]